MLAPAGLLYWYTTSAILAILTLFNIINRLASLRDDSPVSDVDEKVELSENTPPSRPARLCSAARTAYSRHILLSELSIPGWRAGRMRMERIAGTEAFWTVGYTIGVMIISFTGTRDVKSWANQTGWVSIAQIPLIIALAGKNNLVSLLTGVSYEKLNFIHRAAGKVCLAGAWIHTIGYMYLLGGISLIQLQTSLTTWGMISILAFTGIYILSIRIVRRRIYEFFLVAHIILAALFLVGVIMHWRAVDVWIYPGIALWAMDRLLRALRLLLPKSQPTLSVTLLTPSTLKLSFPSPPRWRAGQHFYISVPSMSRLPWELHPFTAATITGELAFIVRVRDGFTRRLKERVESVRGKGLGSEECVEVAGRVEGGYGGSVELRKKDGVVIFAGGSGISFALAHLLQIIADAKNGKSRTRVVKIIWMVKSRLHLNWIAPILAPHLQGIPPFLSIELCIHITTRFPAPKPTQSTLPLDPATQVTDWQAYMEERAAQPARRESGVGRKMSTTSWATYAGDVGEAEEGSMPGTRRGSEAVWRDGRLSVGREDGYAVNGEVLRTFTWSDGYNDDRDPRTNVAGSMPKNDSPTSTPSRSSLSLVGQPHAESGLITSLPPPSPARTRKVSFANGGYRSDTASVHSTSSVGTPRRVSLPEVHIRRPSAASIQRRKSSLPGIVETSPRVDSSGVMDQPLEVSIDEGPTVTSFSPASTFAPTYLQAPPLAFDMSRSSSTQSAQSCTSLSSTNALLPRSGLVTPALAETSRSATSFAEGADERRRLSEDLGMGGIVRWAEGRADPGEEIRGVMEGVEMAEGRVVMVMVCGPVSLMRAVRAAARDEMDVRRVYAGDVRVDYHEESFGW